MPDRHGRDQLPWVEAQHLDCVMTIFPFGTEPCVDYLMIRDVVEQFDSWDWVRKLNSLSKDRICWDVIYWTAEAIKKSFTGDKERFIINPFHPSGLILADLYKEFTIREVRKKRSVVDMDGVHVMKRDTFYQIMLHCMPSGQLGYGEKQGKQLALPFSVLTWDVEVHVVLFVHKVQGLLKGLYFLVNVEYSCNELMFSHISDPFRFRCHVRFSIFNLESEVDSKRVGNDMIFPKIIKIK